MPYSVLLKRTAEKELDGLPDRIYRTVLKRLLGLGEDPRPAGAKKLRGRAEYRLRVGDYRILYLVDDEQRTVDVVSVAHRREAYRR